MTQKGHIQYRKKETKAIEELKLLISYIYITRKMT